MIDRDSHQPSATILARFTGINKTTLDNYLKGRVPNMPAKFLFRIADAFGVSVRWLWLGEGPKDAAEAKDQESIRMQRLFNGTKSAKSREIMLELAQNFHDSEHKSNRK